MRTSPIVSLILMAAASLSSMGTAQAAPRSPRSAAQQGSPDPIYDGRIVTKEDVEAAKKPGIARPLLLLGWPCKELFAAIERGLVAAEQAKLRERLADVQQRIAAAGYTVLFGGLGEKTGLGFGLTYDYPARPPGGQTEGVPAGQPTGFPAGLRVMGRGSSLGYLELMAGYGISPARRTRFAVQGDYQRRPNEPFYGFGQDSTLDDASNFGLQQLSLGVVGELQIGRRVTVGSEYKLALLTASDREGGGRPGVGEVFGELPGLGKRIDLHGTGVFVDAAFFGREYDWGAGAYAGASYQESFSAGDDIRYWHYGARMEGHMPVARGRSAFVGEVRAQLVRESSGSDPLPFYLYPRLGGSATLRGFELDRYYGRTMLMLTLEYRWAIHPNCEMLFFHDGGQTFDSAADFEVLDWHRNYGMGFRLKTVNGTAFRVEAGKADEGWIVHLTFGDRPPPPLSAPVRYPVYRR
jgi:hypothetical protein